MICGLLGKKLGHSYSPQIHAALGNYEYRLFEKQPKELEDFLKYGDFDGLNVTMPYKQTVMPYLDSISPSAKNTGTVNVIYRRDGKLHGHNTDCDGFASMVSKCGFDPKDQKVLVLGSGGASKNAALILSNMGANVVIVSRSGENNYTNLDLHADATIIVNTTPVGMYPNNGDSPVDLSLFPKLQWVLDVVYNPSRTQIMLDAESRGIRTMNGLWMLVEQARAASECFQAKDIPADLSEKIYRTLKSQMENIILIGMPGCGKTTVGKALAEKLGRKFVDADAVIAETAGMSIPDIFGNEGEAGFRNRETKVLSELGKQSGLVIATGGGCVTKEENYPLLHQNARIFWLKRNISELPTHGRPLSQNGNLEQMYRVRKPLYESFADVVIANETVAQTVQQIMEAIK